MAVDRVSRMAVLPAVLCGLLLLAPVAQAGWTYLSGEVGDGNGLLDISMPDERTACAVGVHKPGGSSANSEPLVICTDDAGQTWRPYRPSGTMVVPTAVHMPSALVGFMATFELSGFTVVAKVHRTDDAGRSWAVQTLPADAAGILSDLFFVDEDHGWTVGAPGLFYTLDGGASWQRGNLPDLGTDRVVEGLTFVDALRGWAVGGKPAEEAQDEWSDPVPACCGFVLGTTDGGQSWTMLADGLPQSLRRVSFADGQRGWAVGGGTTGVILNTTDGGVTWTPQGIPAGTYGSADYVSDVDFVDALHGYGVANIGDGSPMVLYTEDGGGQWRVDTSYDQAFDGLTGFDAFARYSALTSLAFPSVGRGMVCGKNAIVVALAGEGFCADADGDGHRDQACGGDDCDDQNAWISPSVEELCNQLDDNCDGVADDGIDFDRDPRHCGSCGFNCQPAQVCWDGLCTTECPAELTRCGQECADLATDGQHCGECDRACSFDQAEGTCLDGACQMGACDADWWDLDGEANNGCEYGCQLVGAEACNGADDDCDGLIDEDLADCGADGGLPDGGADGGSGGDSGDFREPKPAGGCAHGQPGSLAGLILVGLLFLLFRNRKSTEF